jgi:hypothetical protein
MEMKSMKVVDKENSQILVEKSSYPYNLCIRLEGPQLEALGLVNLPAVGSKLMLEAKVNVVSVMDKDGHKCVELQITDMNLETPEQEGAEESEPKESKVVEGSKFKESFYGYMGG